MSSADRYYDAEDQRWPDLRVVFPSRRRTMAALCAWAALYDLKGGGFRVSWSSKRKVWSWCSSTEIGFIEKPSWLLIAHEFAHMIQWRRGYKRRVWHDKHHAELVDQLCCDLIMRGWA